MIEFRMATIEDAEDLARIRVQFLCDGTDDAPHDKQRLLNGNLDFFRQAIESGDFVAWIALDDGQIAATGGVTMYRMPPNRACPNGRTGYISNMYTRPEYRRRGLGSRLLKLVVEEAKRRRCDRIILNSNMAFQSICEQMGFEHSRNSMTYYP